MATVVFTFVLMIGNVLRDVLALLVSGVASPLTVLEAIGLLIPYVWAFALPMALLTATVLVFGRFSADHELTAARASGISLVSLATPILLLSLVLCGLCAAVNLEIAPRCWSAYKSLIYDVDAKRVSALFPEGTFIKGFKGYIFHVGKTRGQKLEDVTVWALENETNTVAYMYADSGRFTVDKAAQKIVMELDRPKSVLMANTTPITSSSEGYTIALDFSDRLAQRKPGIKEMTFGQLCRELQDLERRMQLPGPATNRTALTVDQKRELQKQWQDLTTPVRVLIHQQLALSFACFGFALIGIPLGIRVHRRETNVGFAVAIVLVLLYYSFLLAGQSLATQSAWLPYLIVWLPNFILQGVGAVLLWRANRGI